MRSLWMKMMGGLLALWAPEALAQPATNFGAPSAVAYRISIQHEVSRGDLEGQVTPFHCFPAISVTEGDPTSGDPFVATDAFVTLESPTGAYKGFANHPMGFSGSSLFRTSQQALLDEVNGVWTVRIEEPGGAVYDYECTIGLALPFADLPTVESDTIIEGEDFVSPFDARVEGGNSSFPGPSTLFRFTLFSDDAGFIENQTLPGPTPLWTPGNGIPAGEDTALIEVSTQNTALDTSSWSAGGVTAVTPGASDVEVTSIAGRYTAFRRARLERPATTLCSADFDGDGDVDLSDFGIFGSAFGSSVGDANYNPAADFDGDGDVDLSDFGVFGSQFGNGPAECAP